MTARLVSREVPLFPTEGDLQLLPLAAGAQAGHSWL